MGCGGFNAAEIEILTGPPPAALLLAPPGVRTHTAWSSCGWGRSSGTRHSAGDGGALTTAVVTSLFGRRCRLTVVQCWVPVACCYTWYSPATLHFIFVTS